MDYAFFESLTAHEAVELLREFLESQRRALEEIRRIASRDGVALDYSISTLPSALKWMLSCMHIHTIPVPDNEPRWVHEAHRNGLTQFDEESKPLVLCAAYYLGECFAQIRGLHWTTANPEYLGKNMPVVAGFVHDEELPPLVVVENVFGSILAGTDPATRIDSTIDHWRRQCPAPQN